VPDLPRERRKRFTAECQVRVIGTLAGVRTRWLADSTWSDPEQIEVGTISNCSVDG
jgi:hypothetical protein